MLRSILVVAFFVTAAFASTAASAQFGGYGSYRSDSRGGGDTYREMQLGRVVALGFGEAAGNSRGYGAAIGGSVGGLAGYLASRKSRTGRFVVSGASALLGGIAGDALDRRNRQRPIAVIKLENGRVISLPYTGLSLRPGQEVAVGDGVIVPITP